MLAQITVTCDILDAEDDSKLLSSNDAHEFARDAIEEVVTHVMNRGFNCLPKGITCTVVKVA